MTLIEKFQMHADFAAGYAAQQMIDREAGRHDLAVMCQQRADAHAALSRIARQEFVAYFQERRA